MEEDLAEILRPACPDVEVRRGHSRHASAFIGGGPRTTRRKAGRLGEGAAHGIHQDHRRDGGPGSRPRGCGQRPGIAARLLPPTESPRCGHGAGRSFGRITGSVELAGRPASGRRRDVPAGGAADAPAQARNGGARPAGSTFQDCGRWAFRTGTLSATLRSNRVAGGYWSGDCRGLVDRLGVPHRWTYDSGRAAPRFVGH